MSDELNRVYQGRVSKVKTLEKKDEINEGSGATKKKKVEPSFVELPDWEGALWNHHVLFQDAVNYYIFAIAALGCTDDSPLTKLQTQLKDVWEGLNKNGQKRKGLRDTFDRVLGISDFEKCVNWFKKPLQDEGVSPDTIQLAGERLEKLRGDGAIQKGGRTEWPKYCNPMFEGNFDGDPIMVRRAKHKILLPEILHNEATRYDSVELDQFDEYSIATPDQKRPVKQKKEARKWLEKAIDDLENNAKEREKGKFTREEKNEFDKLRKNLSQKNDEDLEIKGYVGSSTKGVDKLRLQALVVFKKIDRSEFTFNLLKVLLSPSSVKSKKRRGEEGKNSDVDEDVVRKARGKRKYVFRAFTSLPYWTGKDESAPDWSDFDIASFKEALKIYNQFVQNLEKQQDKKNELAKKMLHMDGDEVVKGYNADTVVDKEIRGLFESIRRKIINPKTGETEEEQALPSFSGDPRIISLRRIVNEDLAQEYRLTEGRQTPYGLRKRTIKGWADVRRTWLKRVKPDTPFSEEKRQLLQNDLNELRSGNKQEQIGSHVFFEALIATEEAWAIWRESDEPMQKKIRDNNWATDPVDAFREYCEMRESLETLVTKKLSFTPADPRYSRRLCDFKELSGSFGKSGGKYRHDLKSMAVIVPVAITKEGEPVNVQACRISYSAPRLLRDKMRGVDGALIQNWSQPMMWPFFPEDMEKNNPQKLEDAAVQMMPDFDARGKRRILLNFPVSLDADKIKEKIGNADRWIRQFDFPGKRFLKWQSDFNGEKKVGSWWLSGKSFSILAVDQGTRHAANLARIECSTHFDEYSRFVGEVDDKKWYARYKRGCVVNLPGEDAQTWRRITNLDRANKHDSKAEFDFREELYGSRGRTASVEECRQTLFILQDLQQENLVGERRGEAGAQSLREEFSFPEQNDKLIIAIRRTQGRLASYVSWLWKLRKPDDKEQREKALNDIKEREPELAELIVDPDRLGAKLRETICFLRNKLKEHLLEVTRRVLPLKGRDWEWVPHPDKTECHLLRQTQMGTGTNLVKLAGQRGLSLDRIDQLAELRRRWQSLNQSLRIKLGEKPPTASEMRNDPIPDPCPDILDKLDKIREQRVSQTAHLVLAEALGLKLRAPSPSTDKRATDTHGEYERTALPPVDFIVVENLSRYLSDQGRSKRENSRLMKWCHRSVTHKLCEIAKPFGIEVLEAQPAYTSKFCSWSGIPGFRAYEVNCVQDVEKRWGYLFKLERPTENQSKQRARIKKILNQLEQAELKGKKPMLLIPQIGGPIFVPMRDQEKKDLKKHVAPMNADINAAINIGLRAIAHPSCSEIHHRIRTEREGEKIFVKEKRWFPTKPPEVIMQKGDKMPKERNSNIFPDKSGIAQFGRANISGVGEDSRFATGAAIWKFVNDTENQWKRCEEINNKRLGKHLMGEETFDDDIQQ